MPGKRIYEIRANSHSATRECDLRTRDQVYRAVQIQAMPWGKRVNRQGSFSPTGQPPEASPMPRLPPYRGFVFGGGGITVRLPASSAAVPVQEKDLTQE